MKDLQKINLLQLYLFWKNLSIAIVLLMALLTVNTWLASVFSLFAAIICVFILYARIYINKTGHHPTYMIVGFALMISIIIYTFILLTLVFLHAWGLYDIPADFNLFRGNRTISVLIFAPVSFLTLLYTYIRRKAIHRYIDSFFGIKSDVFLKGKLGVLLTNESKIQVRNLLLLFGVLTVINWIYYLFFFYSGPKLTNKDVYVFFWINMIAMAGYLLYLLIHNYQLDLSLKQSGVLVTPESAANMSPKNYFRYFVISGDKLFVSYDCEDPDYTAHKVLDTPFFMARTGRMITEPEVRRLIENEIGTTDGELRFFFGFQAPGLDKHNVLRYFYFLNGSPEDYPELNEEKGQWMTIEELQNINGKRPHALSSFLLADIARMITITRAEKLYDENGNRKHKLKSYIPSFRFADLRKTTVDFQSDKWLNIAMLNSDKPFFRLRKRMNSLVRGGKSAKVWMV